jgi:hypothetical protein
MQVKVETVLVSEAGPEFPADARVVEFEAVNGKHYYHVQGLIPLAQALRLALRVVEAGKVNPDFWACYEDEQQARQDYQTSGAAAFDEFEAERTYNDDCRASFQAILRAEHDDPCAGRED